MFGIVWACSIMFKIIVLSGFPEITLLSWLHTSGIFICCSVKFLLCPVDANAFVMLYNNDTANRIYR